MVIVFVLPVWGSGRHDVNILTPSRGSAFSVATILSPSCCHPAPQPKNVWMPGSTTTDLGCGLPAYNHPDAILEPSYPCVHIKTHTHTYTHTCKHLYISTHSHTLIPLHITILSPSLKIQISHFLFYFDPRATQMSFDNR